MDIKYHPEGENLLDTFELSKERMKILRDFSNEYLRKAEASGQLNSAELVYELATQCESVEELAIIAFQCGKSFAKMQYKDEILVGECMLAAKQQMEMQSQFQGLFGSLREQAQEEAIIAAAQESGVEA